MARKKQETAKRSPAVKKKPGGEASKRTATTPRAGASGQLTKARGETGNDPQTREGLIRERAYYLAEQRGFIPGYEERDWLAAENDVDSRQASR